MHIFCSYSTGIVFLSKRGKLEAKQSNLIGVHAIIIIAIFTAADVRAIPFRNRREALRLLVSAPLHLEALEFIKITFRIKV